MVHFTNKTIKFNKIESDLVCLGELAELSSELHPCHLDIKMRNR